MNLSEVSLTAVLPLLCRVIQSEKKDSVFQDPMAVLCLQRLLSISSDEEKKRIIHWRKMYARNTRDVNARMRTVRGFDDITNQFILQNPGCTVINLGCGFDTRYWRILADNCHYIELDLPEMITLKREMLQDHLSYDLVGCSVLDTGWIDRVTKTGSEKFLLLAEALFYYLPKQDVIRILQAISQRFVHSQLVLEMALEKYTRGIWKRLIQLESKAWGINVSIVSGQKDPHEIELYATGFKVIEIGRGNLGSIISISINTP